MTELDDRLDMTDTAPDVNGSLWRPFAEAPVLTSTMALGWDATGEADRHRLARYLSAFVAARRSPVHINVAFNAAYFGYDLTTRGYVGGPLDLSAFPQVRFGETTEALPVGAMVNIAAGEQPLFAEIVYKEGAHPALSADGAVLDWLSGAPAGATGPGAAGTPAGGPVLTERLVVDVDAFGQDFSLTQVQLDRLRQRGRWLNADGHLLLDAQYANRHDADLDETAFYARYLLTRGRDQLLSTAAPMPVSTVLSDEAGEEQLAAALNGILRTVADALASLPELRMWRGYAFTRASLATRLADPGPLGGNDLSGLAAGIARTAVPLRRGRWTPERTTTYTAVGPRLRSVRDASPQLADVGYATAVCHANAVISDYARRETDETTGLLPGEVHLRLDDPWQGGGVWRAEHPGSTYAHVDVTEPLGLGWLTTLPSGLPENAIDDGDHVPEPENIQPQPDDEGGFDELTVTDSQVAWTQSLRLTHLLEERLPLPDLIGTQMREAGLGGSRLRLMLTHDGYDLDPAEATQAVGTELFGRPQLTAVAWPLEFFPGIVLTCTWARGAGVARATTTLLDTPVAVDGLEIEHRYDARILTRDAAPGQPRRAGTPGERTTAGTLTLTQRVLRAVRRFGLLDPDGCAVLARTQLPTAVYGTADAGTEVDLDMAVAELVAIGALRTDIGSLDSDRRMRYPAERGAPAVSLVVYEPRPVEGTPRALTSHRDTGTLGSRFLRTHEVAGHLRWLGDIGWTASEEARQAYRRDRARFRLAGPLELPDGYTYVQPFSRGRS